MTAVIRHEIWPRFNDGPRPLEARIESIWRRSRDTAIAVFLDNGELKSCKKEEPYQFEKACACGAKRLVGIYDSRAALEEIEADVRWAMEAMK